ncbi:MAG: methyltransferase domain-containing protein [Patescibacteria group bacterium]
MPTKILKFRDYLVPLILSGEKDVTWRLFDDKNLQAGDEIDLINWNNGEKFATGIILKIREKKLNEIEDNDFQGHEKFTDKEAMLKTYQTYYGDKVNWDTVVKIIKFKIIDNNIRLQDTYNKIAVRWHADHSNDDWWVKGVNKFINYCKKGALILDAGCGAGTKSKYLTQHGLKVIGIDFAEKMIAIAKREVPNANFFTLDINNVDKLDYLFDGIFLQAVIIHFPKNEITNSLKKLASKLKRSGFIYITVKEKKINGVDQEILKENDYGYTHERFFSYFTTDEIRTFLLNSGFEVVYEKVIPSGKTRWIQIMGKKI